MNAKEVVEVYDHLLKKDQSISMDRLALLAKLEQAEDRGVKYTMTKLACTLGISPATCTVAVDNLEKKSLVTRSMNVSDRREVNIHLTERGKSFLQEVLS